jgi:sulfur relay (sulfurtransferase) complex TusBCD TusD component (DsrE family)
MRMSIETLNAAYYRERALECFRLANTAQAAKPLSTRLFFLAKAYEEKAKAVGSEQTAGSDTH